MSDIRLRIVARATLLGTALILPHAGLASEANSARVVISVQGQYASDPFLLGAGDTGAGAIVIAVEPSYTLRDETGSLSIQAVLQRIQYFKRYGSDDTGVISANAERRLSEKFRVSGQVRYENAVITANRLLANGFLPSLGFPVLPETDAAGTVGSAPVTAAPPLPSANFVPAIVGEDIALIGSRQRRSTISAGGRIEYQPNARDVFYSDITAARSRYPDLRAIVAGYSSFGGNIGYSRVLSARSRIGARVGFARTRFDGVSDTSNVVSPQLTYNTQLTTRWSLSAAAGVAIANSEAGALRTNSTSLAVDVQACRAGERSNLCLAAARSTVASALEGVRPQTVVRASYVRRLDELSNMTAFATYSRTGGGDINHLSNSADFAGIGIAGQRSIGRRLQATAGLDYQTTVGNNLGRRSNVSGRIGVAYLLGSRR